MSRYCKKMQEKKIMNWKLVFSQLFLSMQQCKYVIVQKKREKKMLFHIFLVFFLSANRWNRYLNRKKLLKWQKCNVSKGNFQLKHLYITAIIKVLVSVVHRIKTFHNPKEKVKQKKFCGLSFNLKGYETSYVDNKTGQAFDLQGCVTDLILWMT